MTSKLETSFVEFLSDYLLVTEEDSMVETGVTVYPVLLPDIYVDQLSQFLFRNEFYKIDQIQTLVNQVLMDQYTLRYQFHEKVKELNPAAEDSEISEILNRPDEFFQRHAPTLVRGEHPISDKGKYFANVAIIKLCNEATSIYNNLNTYIIEWLDLSSNVTIKNKTDAIVKQFGEWKIRTLYYIVPIVMKYYITCVDEVVKNLSGKERKVFESNLEEYARLKHKNGKWILNDANASVVGRVAGVEAVKKCVQVSVGTETNTILDKLFEQIEFEGKLAEFSESLSELVKYDNFKIITTDIYSEGGIDDLSQHQRKALECISMYNKARQMFLSIKSLVNDFVMLIEGCISGFNTAELFTHSLVVVDNKTLFNITETDFPKYYFTLRGRMQRLFLFLNRFDEHMNTFKEVCDSFCEAFELMDTASMSGIINPEDITTLNEVHVSLKAKFIDPDIRVEKLFGFKTLLIDIYTICVSKYLVLLQVYSLYSNYPTYEEVIKDMDGYVTSRPQLSTDRLVQYLDEIVSTTTHVMGPDMTRIMHATKDLGLKIVCPGCEVTIDREDPSKIGVSTLTDVEPGLQRENVSFFGRIKQALQITA